ncbi:MAG TPA: tetratricopeptide repeat protein [Allocoleopsis sp.]
MHPSLKSVIPISATVLLSLASPLPLPGTSLGIFLTSHGKISDRQSSPTAHSLLPTFQPNQALTSQNPKSQTDNRNSPLAQAQTDRDRQQSAEAEQLYQTAVKQYRQNQFQPALDTFQKALVIFRDIGDKVAQRKTLNNIAIVYDSLGQYPKAIESYQQLLVLVRDMNDKAGEGTALNNIAAIYSSQGQYPNALEFYQQALAIFRAINDTAGERTALNSIAIVHRKLGQNAEALESYQQLLALVRAIKDRAGEGTTLNNIAVVYRELNQYPQALNFFEQALAIHQELSDRIKQAETLNNIAVIYREQAQYPKAIESFEQALALYIEVSNLPPSDSELYTALAGQVTVLSNLAGVYNNLGQYAKARDFYQEALNTYQKLNQWLIAHQKASSDKPGEAKTLNNIGDVYQNLGDYAKSIEFYQQALDIFRAIGDKAGQRTSLNNIAVAYGKQNQSAKALDFFNQALAMTREIGDKTGEIAILNNLAAAYRNQSQYPQAIASYQQALAIEKEVGDRAGQGITLTGLGAVYFKQNQYAQALEFYHPALAIAQEVGDKEGEAIILSNIGVVLEQQQQPEIAIVFYKQSVNVRETIRQDMRSLSREQQESYTQTVANTYRSLANLLLSQGRILEAQQVLELLKVQEIRDFTREARIEGQPSEIALNLSEKRIVEKYGTLIAFGKQVYDCAQKQCAQFSQLNDQLDVLTREYNQTVETLIQEVRTRIAQDPNILDPTKLAKVKEIVDAKPGTVLIYPFVQQNKISLLWASTGGVFKSIEVPVGQRQLGETVLKFRQLLQNPNSDLTQVKATGKQLYDWLIKPIESELKSNRIQNLVFSLDRVTRYIPMSALFDGETYLVENYAVSTVLSADLTMMSDRLPPGTENTTVVALGLSNAVAGFNPLPNVPAELDAIVRKQPSDKTGIYPGIEFLNQAFDFRALRDNLVGRKILHIATHGQFVPGRPEESFIVLGTGEHLTIPQIQTLQYLGNIHLVVLSACETALGGPDSDGIEISGISSYFLNGGAKAVMASLWLVNDRSTSQLMRDFYRHLAQGTATVPIAKAEALRQAQLSLLRGSASTSGNTESRSSIQAEARQTSQATSTPNAASGFSHPYYWAPFILIGNGL